MFYASEYLTFFDSVLCTIPAVAHEMMTESSGEQIPEAFRNLFLLVTFSYICTPFFSKYIFKNNI